MTSSTCELAMLVLRNHLSAHPVLPDQILLREAEADGDPPDDTTSRILDALLLTTKAASKTEHEAVTSCDTLRLFVTNSDDGHSDTSYVHTVQQQIFNDSDATSS